MKNIIVILGTRPEAVKLAPLIIELKKQQNINVTLCNTEQQKELSNQTLGFFNIIADINLNIMRPDQTLAGLQTRMLDRLNEVFSSGSYDAAIVQGDTMSVFCGALAAFYNRVPVFHVEAGLRSYNLAEPYPEEAFREMTSKISALHFAPTTGARNNLLQEHIDPDTIFVTGNTVIDALKHIPANTLAKALKSLHDRTIDTDSNLVLVTAHRRENHGSRLDEIINAVKKLSCDFPDHQFVIPVHPNPNVKNKIYDNLSDLSNIILTEPMDYPEMVCLMQNAKLILTDSGGIQEEAPTFGVPVLVMRYETERHEGLEAGFSKLVGTSAEKIYNESSVLLRQNKSDIRLDSSKNPYGDGLACQKIINQINQFFDKR